MLEVRVFREQLDEILADHEKRGISVERVEVVVDADGRWRKLRGELDGMNKLRNELGKEIAAAKKAKDEKAAEAALAKMANWKTRRQELEEQERVAREERDTLRMRVPNILHPSVPVGEDEEQNVELEQFGDRPTFDFDPRTHNELTDLLGADLERAAKVAGSRFYFLTGDLARLELALRQYALDFLIGRGFTLVDPPFMMNRDAYEGVTDLGDFEDVMYKIEDHDYYLIATSEHPLTAMFKDEKLPQSALPLKMVGMSHCFRREAGTRGMADRGIWRVHQFYKIEQIIISDEENSWTYHEELLENARAFFQSLGLHCRVINICTGDIGTVAAKKYDIEAWMPTQEKYKEVVSCSNCTSYQAVRLNMKYRTKEANLYCHTLNSTLVATSRALAALLETWQLEDGSVTVPEVLRPYMGNMEKVQVPDSIFSKKS